MDLNSDQKELLETFVEQEYLISILYKLFAKLYPEYRDFWTKIAKEELDHASLIKRISHGISCGEILFAQGELRSSMLVSSMKYIKGLINEFRNTRDIPVMQAVNTALTLEKSLWETQVFNYFEGDSDEVRKVMDSLNAEQRIHVTKIEMFALHMQKKASV